MKPKEVTTQSTTVPHAEPSEWPNAAPEWPNAAPAQPQPARASAPASASGMAPAAAVAASGPDLVLPASKAKPLARGAAMRNAPIDFLNESAKDGPAPEERDDVCAGDERPRPRPATRQSRERKMAPPQPYWHDDQLEAVEPCAREPAPAVPVAAGAAANYPGRAPGRLAWSANDISLESGERLHRVAVVAPAFIEPLRPPRMARPGSLPPLRPKSKAECERRCGSDGFCDPSDLLGCGGVHCGRQFDMLN